MELHLVEVLAAGGRGDDLVVRELGHSECSEESLLLRALLQGAIYQLSGGNSISVTTDESFAISDFLRRNLLPLLTPRFLIGLVLVAAVEFFLRRTRAGRNFFIVGGNRNTAWLAGINTDRYLVAAFVLSSLMAAVGGVVSVLVSTAATLKLGENSLMYLIFATIIGGTAMSGGNGGVLRTVVAIMSLRKQAWARLLAKIYGFNPSRAIRLGDSRRERLRLSRLPELRGHDVGDRGDTTSGRVPRGMD